MQALGTQSEDIYSCLVEHSADGMVVSDAKGVITGCNPAFAKLLGRAQTDIVGRQLHSLIDENAERHDAHGHLAHDTASGAPKNDGDPYAPQTKTIVCKNGNLPLPVSTIPIKSADGKSQASLTIIYVVQANTVQQAQTEFVSTVSHELRTPLTSIKGFADTILRAGDRLDLSQQRRYVGIIKDQADRLTRLVEDLLAVSRLESKRMQLTIRAIDLNGAIQRVQRNLSDKAKEHRIIIRVPAGLPPVWADADRLEQILTNLIDNAIKYSPPKTTVTVTARDNSEMIEFIVADQGVGIPQEHLGQIFTKFSRLDNPLVRQTEGTGLGLYITRSLVLALGGQIKVTSSNAGTEFTVQLPAATLEEQAARGRDV